MYANGNIPEGLCQCGCGLPTGIATQDDKRRGVSKGDRLKYARTGHNKRKFVSVDGMYKCRRCKGLFAEGQIIRDIYRNGQRSDIGFCKPCQVQRAIEYKRRNPVQQKMVALQTRMRQYGLTLDDYVSMYEAQRGRCAICGIRKQSQLEIDTKRNSTLNVDHCHATGDVRGLLCTACNHGLGRFFDNPETLRAAADYLERSRQ